MAKDNTQNKTQVAVQEAPTQEGSVKCRCCGKLMANDANIQRGVGPVCFPRVRRYMKTGEELIGEAKVTEGRLAEILTAARREMPPNQNQASEAPVLEDGRAFVKVARMHEHCVANGVKVGWMVKAFGGDRATKPPLSPKWKPMYYGHNRWLHPDCMTPAGLDELRTMAGEPRKTKPKAEQPKTEQPKAAVK